MKTAHDPRHLRRIALVQDLFSWQFHSKNTPKVKETSDILDELSQIDQTINKSAPDWPLTQINKVDLAILRLSVYEMMIKKNTPIKVIVDEAVELAKQFGADSSPSFINGVLGKVITTHHLS
jgi:transcription antitermination factor NusB